MMRQQCLRMHKLLFCSIIIWTYHHYHLNLCLITLSTQVVNYPLFAFVPSRSKQWCGLLVLNKEREKIITSLLSVVHHITKACTNKISERCILYSIKDVRDSKNYVVLATVIRYIYKLIYSRITDQNELIWISLLCNINMFTYHGRPALFLPEQWGDMIKNCFCVWRKF